MADATDKAIARKAGDTEVHKRMDKGEYIGEMDNYSMEQDADIATRNAKSKMEKQDTARKAALASKGKTDADMEARITKLKNYTSGKSSSLD